ncbi:helix-turn-helix transcriptional regulator [Paenibacillus amylolyticus]|nr:helix-turn-helix transcriptional regulator [Paenibacillus amylolyticus]
MTPYALSKAFKQVSGINFIDYLTRVRMDAAKQLLRETTMKINDVAAAVGYQHSYFNRIFKKQEGVTPSQYHDQWFGHITVRIFVISDWHPALVDVGFLFTVIQRRINPQKMCNSTCYVMFSFLWKWRYSGLFGQ